MGRLAGQRYHQLGCYRPGGEGAPALSEGESCPMLSTSVSEASDNISANCLRRGKNLGSLGVNLLKKEFFILVNL